MRIAVALLLAAPAAANPYCSLLPANAPGFEMRAVHTEENQWLAEIELVEWVEGARIKLEWAGGMTIAQANHAEVVDPEYNGATVVLAPAQTALGEMSAAGRPWRVLVLGYEKEVIMAGGGGGAPPLTEINLGEAPKRRK